MPAKSESRYENLAVVFQEILTAIVRLRESRQAVADAQTFRSQMRKAISVADKEARQKGYSQETVRLATFAVVAFVDESVLNLQTTVFTDWVRRPLQTELFGVHVAGEIFFDDVRRLLAQVDSPELADLLEVHQLCLLLGYRGKYGAGSHGELHAIKEAIGDKIRRNRSGSRDLSPAWGLPRDDKFPERSDPWVRRMALIFAGCLLLAIVLFSSFAFSLRSGMSALEALTTQSKR